MTRRPEDADDGGGSNLDPRDSSAEARALFRARAAELKELLTRRREVVAAMSQFEATGVSEEYHAEEQRWNTKAGEVRDIISTLRRAERRDRGDGIPAGG